MKKHLQSLLLMGVLLTGHQAAAQDFTWIKGPNTTNQTSNYGSLGVSSPSNLVGSRSAPQCWTDASNNLWLLGGNAMSGVMNDLWKYNPSSNEWVWVHGDNTPTKNGVYGTKGVAAPTNKPGSRNLGLTWVDNTGNLWLLGGAGYGASGTTIGQLNDLWKYNPSTNQWTWVNGDSTLNVNGVYGTQGVAAPSNKPGSRYASARWVDASNNLWLFGGVGNPAFGNATSLNDLWKYNITTNQWTWVSGSMFGGNYGTYGTLGVASATNTPGARIDPNGWQDATGNFWLFGGSGLGATAIGMLNDLWRYNPTTNQWAWIKGDSSVNKMGRYGTITVSSPTTNPGGRQSSASWVDASGNFWLHAGSGKPASGNPLANVRLSDLWRYNPTANQWTWMKGDSIANPTANYGSLGIPAATNKPGSRNRPGYWKTSTGQVFIFGGDGFATTTTQGLLNDLWLFAPSVTNVEDQDGNVIMSIYPNPASSVITLETEKETLISIVNVLGETLFTQSVNGTQTIHVSQLNSGIYFIRNNANGKAVKFIKE